MNMNNNECSIPAAFYDDLKQRFLALLTEHGLLQEKVSLQVLSIPFVVVCLTLAIRAMSDVTRSVTYC